MAKVKLRVARNDGGPFHRTRRDDEGGVIETMEFPVGVTVEVDADQLKAVLKDVGHALVEVDDKGKPVDKESAEVAAARKDAEKKEKERLKEKEKAAADDGEALNDDGTPKRGKRGK